MSAPFIHLHVHSAYSLLDGAIRVGDLVKTAKAMDMPAVALTDHGNMFGVFKFYKEAKKAKIKPIIGCETYITPKSRHRRDQSDPRYHLILLAMNHLGYQNLNRLISMANTEGFYYKPRIDFEILEKYSEGIIASSACLQGQVPRLLLSGQEEEAAKAAKRYADLFPGRFYLELQKNYIPEQDLANQGLIRLAKKLGLPLVATNDCHYLKKTDADSHDVLLCIQTGKTVDDENRMRMSTQEFWFKGPQDMVDLFADVPEAIENTLKIAEACDVELPLGQYHFPEFRLEDGESLESKLRQMAQEGFEKRLIEIRETAKGDFGPDQEKEYRDRLAHELDVIVRMGFPGYFLIVADFINYAKQNRIPVGPGRGSAAGSLAAYATGITDIDPIRYGLLFERFLNVERISMPDIDVDFCTDGRDQVIRYVAEKYGGQEHVAQIITFGQLQARAVIKDVGRAMGMPYGEVDKIAKLIPERQKITLEDALKEEPRLAQAARENPQVAQLIETAKSLEALPRHASKHAAGVVIGDRPLVEYLPLYAVSSGVEGEAAKDVVTQFDMKGVEDIGLIKFDFLGLKTLTLIDHILKLIVRAGKPAVDMARLPMDDEEAFKLLCRGDTTGVFQLESSGMREILIKLRPNRFEDIIALVALYRPGPLKSGMVDQFIQRKHGLIPVEYELPQLEPMLAETYGVILYQEQVMQISNVLANYSLGEADLLRRAMGKKIAEVMAEQKGRFMQGARENQLDEKKAGHIFELMANFAEYGFNKSHSAAYALVAYHTAYLKANYPVEFMAALLTAEVSNQDKIVRFIGECREKGITVLPPDINQSDIQFTVVDGRIRFGLAAIKGVGQAAIDSILEARTSRPYTDLFDFCERVDLRRVNRRVIEALIKCGAMDMGGAGRAKMAAALDDALERGARLQKEKEEGQINLFAAMAETDAGPPAIRWPDVPEWRESQRLNYEKEALGFYITGHPLARYERELAALTDTNSEKLKEQADKTRVRMGGMVIKIQQKLTKKGDRMAFVSLEDLTGVAEILVFPDTFKTAQPILETDQPVLVVGETTVDEKGGAATVKIKAFEFHPLESALEKMAKAAVFSISTTGMQPADLGRLKALIESHRGSTPVLLKLRVPGAGAAVFKLTTGVRPSRTLLTEARRVFGDSVVELKYS